LPRKTEDEDVGDEQLTPCDGTAALKRITGFRLEASPFEVMPLSFSCCQLCEEDEDVLGT
jgi:hypothetical protein